MAFLGRILNMRTNKADRTEVHHPNAGLGLKFDNSCFVHRTGNVFL